MLKEPWSACESSDFHDLLANAAEIFVFRYKFPQRYIVWIDVHGRNVWHMELSGDECLRLVQAGHRLADSMIEAWLVGVQVTPPFHKQPPIGIKGKESRSYSTVDSVISCQMQGIHSFGR